MTFTERLICTASLLATFHRIGWAHKPTAHFPPRPTASPGQFIASRFLWILFYFILFDTARILGQENPCFSLGGLRWRLVGGGGARQCGCPSSRCAVKWAGFTRLAVLSVSPLDSMNPEIGRTYLDRHSMLTRCENVGGMFSQRCRFHSPFTVAFGTRCTSHSNFLTNALHLPRGTFTNHSKLFTSFFEGTSVLFFVL